jgi:hypothetical protein
MERFVFGNRKFLLFGLIIIIALGISGLILFPVLGPRLVPALPAEVLRPPYPASSIITEVSFDWSSHDRRAPGSDNWPITWGADGHQYTSWGDGGGFGGTNNDGRVSLGVARVTGSADDYTGHNVWGGKDPENPAQFEGKSYGIISIEGILYKWVSPLSDANNYEEARLARSSDYGATWTLADWAFTEADELVLPTICQFGQDYAGARDNYVYSYAIRLNDARSLKVQRPGQIDLMRVPVDRMMDRMAYEFFAGLDNDKPIWTTDLEARSPVFEDFNGVGWTVSVSYNPGLDRYILATEHGRSFQGNLGLFDAPEPWGPWTTVHYEPEFGSPQIEASSFFWNFSNKWLSADGRDFVLVFTGIGENDSWNTVRGRFTTASAAR